jgi:hypothetical protein
VQLLGAEGGANAGEAGAGEGDALGEVGDGGGVRSVAAAVLDGAIEAVDEVGGGKAFEAGVDDPGAAGDGDSGVVELLIIGLGLAVGDQRGAVERLGVVIAGDDVPVASR